MTNLTYPRESDQKVFLQDSFTDAAINQPIEVSLCSVAGNPLGKGTSINEDAVALKKEDGSIRIAAFDGSANSIVCPYLAELGINGARFVSGFLQEQLLQSSLSVSPVDFLAESNRKLQIALENLLKENGIKNPPRLPMSTATVVDINLREQTLRYAHVGDCQLHLQYRDGTTAQILRDQVEPSFQTVLREFARIVEEESSKNGGSVKACLHDEGLLYELHEVHLPKLNALSGDGFGVINGTEEVLQYIESDVLPIQNIQQLILCTDGLIADGLDQMADDIQRTLFTHFSTEGFPGVIAWKQQIENEDPEFLRFPRFKHSDDASGVSVRFT